MAVSPCQVITFTKVTQEHLTLNSKVDVSVITFVEAILRTILLFVYGCLEVLRFLGFVGLFRILITFKEQGIIQGYWVRSPTSGSLILFMVVW